MCKHRNKVRFRWCLLPFLEEALKVDRTFHEFLFALLPGIDQPIFRPGRYDIRPARESAPLFKREIKQRRQHHCCQLDRNTLHPIELFADWQGIEYTLGPLADGSFETEKVLWRHNGTYHHTMDVMLGWVHTQKVRQGDPAVDRVQGRVIEHKTADARVRRKHLVVHIDRHDVLEFRDRPIWPISAFRAVMHRSFFSETCKIRMHGVAYVEIGSTHIDFIERYHAREIGIR